MVKQLGKAASTFTETMLGSREQVVVLQEGDYVIPDNSLKYLYQMRGEGDWPVVSRVRLIPLLVDRCNELLLEHWRDQACFKRLLP